MNKSLYKTAKTLIVLLTLLLTSKHSFSQDGTGFIIKQGKNYLLDSTAIAKINRDYDSTCRCCIRERLLLRNYHKAKTIADSLSEMVLNSNDRRFDLVRQLNNKEAEAVSVNIKLTFVQRELTKSKTGNLIRTIVIGALAATLVWSLAR
jgi:hypothetical protein